MVTKYRCLSLSLFVCILFILSISGARAQEIFGDKIELHGYGHQAFLISNSNTNGKYFHDADTRGSFDLNALALLLSFKATDDLTIWAQLFAGTESDVRLDWAFVDYQLTDWLRVRGGQIKTPLGLLNENRDIKYNHLSTLEPLIYQETAGIMFESFRGASAVLEHELGDGEVKLDLFGGAPVYFEGDEKEEKHYGLVGARLNYELPLQGLKIGGTIATTREKEEQGASGSKTIIGGSLEFKYSGLGINSEYFSLNAMEHKSYGYYGEAGYTFFDKLTPFVRYDYLTTNKEDKSNPANYQKNLSFGVGYKFNKYVSIKVEDHIVKGYALSNREFEEEFGTDLNGDKHWNLFATSLNFIF